MGQAAIWTWGALLALWGGAVGAETAHAPGPAVPTAAAAPPAGPRPAEPPPDGFTGTQYIDSAGCVFLRGADGWIARRGPDDAPVCGWPPTLAARRTDPDAVDVLTRVEPPAPPPGPEEVLMTTLAEGLRDGEWAGDHRTPEPRQPAAPLPRPADGPLADLGAMVAAAPALAAATALPGARDDKLCRLLGGEAAAPGTATLGQDPTSGFCPGLAPIVLPGASQQAASAPVPADTAAASHEHVSAHPPPTVAAADRPASAAKDTARPAALPVETAAASERPARRAAAPRPAAAKSESRDAVTVEMIPPSARFVIVGAFDSPQAAQTVSDRLRGYGYPVARGRITDPAPAGATAATAPTVILAGPFADRRAIVAALNDLRGRGYVARVAR